MKTAHIRQARLWAFFFLAAGAIATTNGGCSGPQSPIATPTTPEGDRPHGVGTLLLACRPVGCTVSLDERVGREVGPDAMPFPLPAGEYRALLSAEGYLPVRELLRIEAGQVTEWAVDLWPEVDGVDNDR